MDFTIRHAVPDEYDALGEITARAYLLDGLLDFDTAGAYVGRLRNVAERAADAHVLVAVAGDGAPGGPPGGRVLGGVTFVPCGGPMADIAGPGEAEIRMLAVAHEARGRGVGEALVRACVERARALEDRRVRIVLSTQRTMRTAHRLYERLGFVRVPGRDWNPLPELDDIMLLAYALTL